MRQPVGKVLLVLICSGLCASLACLGAITLFVGGSTSASFWFTMSFIMLLITACYGREDRREDS